jgi:hypothetical protein
VKAAKSQQILPSDRKYLDPVGVGAHRDGNEPAVLAASATARRERFRSGYKSSAVGGGSEDGRKNPHEAATSRLAMSRCENLTVRRARA